jgi:histidinol-phosphate/aromatic aminotransferase/cobyric acid decarboxylase-like protein/adenosyl cobinamide kinase/adenosyl cobinamide phosphate guanylyltransferase
MPLVLVLGGVRSGKSKIAERIAAAAGEPVCYLATGSGSDPEMAERIERHRARRPAGWRTVERDDPGSARVAARETLLLDGIAPWLARRMGEEGLWTEEAVAPLGHDGRAAYERVLGSVRAFAREAAERPGLTVAVADESGLGLVPTGAGTRRYLDLAGEATQALAERAEQVVLVVAGQPIDLAHRPSPGRDRPALGDPRRSLEGPAAGPHAPLDRSVGLEPPTQSPPVPPWPDPSVLEGRRAAESPPDPPVLEGRRIAEGPSAVPGSPVCLAPPALANFGQLRVHGDGMIAPGQLDFAVNVVAGGPPEWLREAMVSALGRVGAYPDEREAVAALAERHGRGPDEVMATNGSAEAFWLLASVLRPCRAVVVHPSFTEPEAALRAAAHRVDRAFRDPRDFTLDPSVVPEEADLVVVGNPNNPTGTVDPAAVVTGLARPGRVLVVDEAFMELMPGEPESLAGGAAPGSPERRAAPGSSQRRAAPGSPERRAGPHGIPGLVVVRSLTKLWSLAGVRAGYLLAPADVVAAARAVRQPWSVNGLACAALAAWARRTAASGGAEATAMAERVAAARAELSEGLAALPGLRVWPSAANFLLVRVPDGEAARAGLAERGIAVRRADTFPGLTGDHLRVAVRCPDDNRRLVEALDEVLTRLARVGGR